MAGSILTNTLVAASGRVVSSVVGVIIIALISRYLGVAHFGMYSLIIAYGAVVQIAADGGLYLTLTRLIAAYPEQEHHYLQHITAMRAAALIIVLAAGAAGTRLIPSLQDATLLYLIAAAGFSAQSLSQLAMGVFQKYGVIWRAVAGDISARLVQLGVLVALGPARITLYVATALFAASAVLALVVHRALLPRRYSLRPVFHWHTWRSIMRQSWPLGVLLIINTIYFRMDTIILSLFRSTSDVGLYSIAYRIIESGLFFSAMFGGLLLPALTSAIREGQPDKTARHFNQGLMVLLWAAVLVVIVTQLFSEEIVYLIAGSNYSPAAFLLKILGFALAAMMIGNLGGFTLVAFKRQKVMLVLALSLAVFNTVANIIFIPVFGAAAAAVTTVLTEICAAVTALVLVSRHLPIYVKPSFLARLLLTGGLTAGLAALIPPSVSIYAIIFQLIAVSAVYILLTIMVQPLRLQDISTLTARAYAKN